MTPEKSTLLLIADSTIDPLARYLAETCPDLKIDVAPFDQTYNTLTSQESLPGRAVAIFSQPDRISSEFINALQYAPFNREKLIEQVQEFAGAVCSAAGRVNALIVYNWIMPPWATVNDMSPWRGQCNLHNILSEMNVALANSLAEAKNVYLLDQADLLLGAGGTFFDPKLWALGKVLYSRCALQAFARQIGAIIDSLGGRSRKLIIVDLDNTLWGGIVGDDGWQNLNLGGIDPIGEAYAMFQKQLKAMLNRGVLLGIVSANEQDVALEAIRKHPEMILSIDDFVGWRINWKDKAENIADLVTELNLGLGSVVFIDDDPHQRERVRQGLGEVLVPDWPSDPVMYPMALKQLRCFETGQIGSEDRRRTEMYRQERRRTETLSTAGSRDAWLAGLELKVTAEPISETNLPRAAQLLNRTNQFNLTTRRMTEHEYWQWACRPNRQAIVFHSEDKFGSYGLVGLMGLEFFPHAQTLTIVDFILSCRTLGRGVEQAMLATAARLARKAEFDTIEVDYVPTAKNKPMLHFLESIPQIRRADNTFTIRADDCRCPEHLELSDRTNEEASNHARVANC